MRIAIFGATGPTGRLLTDQSLSEGHDVTAFIRDASAISTAHPRLRLAVGDVRDMDAVSAAVQGNEVVLSTLGTAFTRAPVDVYSAGGRNILSAMRSHGVRRLACVTSSALESGASTGSWFVDKIMQPLVVKTIGRTVYADMHRLEALLPASDVCWTVLRPSGLCETPEVTDYLVGARHLPYLFTSRADLADALLRQATDDTWAYQTVAVSTPQVSSSVLQMFRQEGLSTRRRVRQPAND